MRKLILCSLVGLGLFGCSGTPPEPPSSTASARPLASPSPASSSPVAAADWQPFKDPDATFTVSFPSPPREVPGDSKLAVKYQSLAPGLAVRYMVQRFPNLTHMTADQAFLDKMTKAVGSQGVKVTSHKFSKMQNVPLLQMTMDDGKSSSGVVWFLATEKYAYQLTCDGKASDMTEKDKKRFFESFHLEGPVAAPSGSKPSETKGVDTHPATPADDSPTDASPLPSDSPTP